MPLLALFVPVCSKDVQIITYWGQNSAYGADSREERDLVDICREDSPYDIVNIGFVNKFFDPMNTRKEFTIDFILSRLTLTEPTYHSTDLHYYTELFFKPNISDEFPMKER
eukprot:gene15427-6668_t